MDQRCVLGNHGVKFGENWITLDHYIKSPLEIYVYSYKWVKNIGIVMKFGMNVYFVYLNHITKFFYGRKLNLHLILL